MENGLQSMAGAETEIEVRVKGRAFVTVRAGELKVDGADLYTDLVNLARVAGILTDILDTSLTALEERERVKTAPSA